jgi:hypothetical protein
MDLDEAIVTICGEEGHFDPDLLVVFVDEKPQLAAIQGGID